MNEQTSERTNGRTHEKSDIVNVLCEKTTNLRKKSEENVQKRRFPVYFRSEKNFSRKSDSVMF